MFRHIVFRLVAGLVLLAAITGIAFFAYQAGVTHGALIPVQAPAVTNGMPYYTFFWHPFFGLGIFGLFFGFFLLCLAFGAMRMMIFGPRWGWRHMHRSENGEMTGHGPMGRGPWGEGVPPMFREWHQRMHDNPEEPSDKKSGE